MLRNRTLLDDQEREESDENECDGPEFRILYRHRAVKEILLLKKTCASVKQSELPLQAAAQKLTSDFEKSCANPKNHTRT